jgi:hypothetical protein
MGYLTSRHFSERCDNTLDDNAKNPRLDPLVGETSTPITKSRHDSNESGIDSNDGETKEYHHMPVFHPSVLVGKALLMDPHKDGHRFRARTVRAIEDDDGETADNPTYGALIDRGANGGFAGVNPRVIFKTGRHVDVRGIEGSFHSMSETITANIFAFYHDALKTLSSITTRLAYSKLRTSSRYPLLLPMDGLLQPVPQQATNDP